MGKFGDAPSRQAFLSGLYQQSINSQPRFLGKRRQHPDDIFRFHIFIIMETWNRSKFYPYRQRLSTWLCEPPDRTVAWVFLACRVSTKAILWYAGFNIPERISKKPRFAEIA